MAWSKWTRCLVIVLACAGLVCAGLACARFALAQPPADSSDDIFLTLTEEGKPPQKCRLLYCWTDNGVKHCQVQAVDTGEMMTVVDPPLPPEAPELIPDQQPPAATRIFHWGSSKTCPDGFPQPPAALAGQMHTGGSCPTCTSGGTGTNITGEPPIYMQRPPLIGGGPATTVMTQPMPTTTQPAKTAPRPGLWQRWFGGGSQSTAATTVTQPRAPSPTPPPPMMVTKADPNANSLANLASGAPPSPTALPGKTVTTTPPLNPGNSLSIPGYPDAGQNPPGTMATIPGQGQTGTTLPPQTGNSYPTTGGNPVFGNVGTQNPTNTSAPAQGNTGSVPYTPTKQGNTGMLPPGVPMQQNPMATPAGQTQNPAVVNPSYAALTAPTDPPAGVSQPAQYATSNPAAGTPTIIGTAPATPGIPIASGNNYGQNSGKTFTVPPPVPPGMTYGPPGSLPDANAVAKPGAAGAKDAGYYGNKTDKSNVGSGVNQPSLPYSKLAGSDKKDPLADASNLIPDSAKKKLEMDTAKGSLPPGAYPKTAPYAGGSTQVAANTGVAMQRPGGGPAYGPAYGPENPGTSGGAIPLGMQSVNAAYNGLNYPIRYMPTPFVTTPAPTTPPYPPPPNIPNAPQPVNYQNAFTPPEPPQGSQGGNSNMGMNPYMQGNQGIMPVGYNMGQPMMYPPYGNMYQQPMMPPGFAYPATGTPMNPLNVPRSYPGPTPPNPTVNQMSYQQGTASGYGYPPSMYQGYPYPQGTYANPAMDRPALPMIPPQATSVAADEAIYQLLATLKTSMYPAQREWAALGLGKYDWHNQPHLVQGLLVAAKEDPAPTVRVACIKTLVRLGVTRELYTGTLQTMHDDIDPRVRQAAEEALGTASASPAAVTPAGHSQEK